MTFLQRIIETLVLLFFGSMAFIYGLVCYSAMTLLVVVNNVLSVWVDE